MNIIDEYDDEQVIGQCAVFDTETGETEVTGNLIGKTVKVIDDNGTVSLDREWYPES
jgi:hypothetical protein